MASYDAFADIFHVLQAVPAILFALNGEGRVAMWNAESEAAFGVKASEALGRTLEELRLGWDEAAVGDLMQRAGTADVRSRGRNGQPRTLRLSVTPIRVNGGGPAGTLIAAWDITQQVELDAQVRQAQKLEAIGRLAAGIVHEINTPAQFAGHNLYFLESAFGKIVGVLSEYRDFLARARAGELDVETIAAAEERLGKLKIDILIRETPKAISQASEGINRISEIVGAMRELTYSGVKEKVATDINKALQNAILLSSSEWKLVAEVKTELNPALPLVPCLPGEISQVFVNIIVNAAQAITGAKSAVEPGRVDTITVRTRTDGRWAVIEIADTGPGIAGEFHELVFDPFFTTKGVGEGTGQGLAIARSVVVDKHGGKISFDSRPSKGTMFLIYLPLSSGEVLAM